MDTLEMKKATGKSPCLDIYPPNTNGDSSLQHFEMNLKESITLLEKYQKTTEKNKQIQEEVENRKQLTIARLVHHLLDRKKDQETVSKCITILNKIKGDFEKIKRELQVAKEKASVEKRDYGAQCDLGSEVYMPEIGFDAWKKEAGPKAERSKEENFRLPALVGSSPRKVEVKESGLDHNDSADYLDWYGPSQASQSKSQSLMSSQFIQGSQRRKGKNPQKLVATQDSESQKAQVDNSSDSDFQEAGDLKRVALAPKTTNLFNNTLAYSQTRGSGRNISARRQLPRLDRNQSVLPFSIKKRAREVRPSQMRDLSAIYSGCRIFRAFKNPARQNESTAVANSALTSAGNPSGNKYDQFEPEEIGLKKRRNVRFSVNANSLNHGFAPQYSTRPPSKSPTEKDATRKRNKLKPKRSEISSNGKLLVQTTLASYTCKKEKDLLDIVDIKSPLASTTDSQRSL